MSSSRESVADVERVGHVVGERVEARPLARAIPPLPHEDHAVAPAGGGEQQVFEPFGQRALQALGEVGDEQAGEEVAEPGRLFGVAEPLLHDPPEPLVEAELLELVPGGRRLGEIERLARLGKGVEQRPQDRVVLGLVAAGDDRDHLAVEVVGRVLGQDEALEPAKPLLGCRETSAGSRGVPAARAW